jgi:hypothetical protein
MTFITYTHDGTIGKSNDFEVFESKKNKRPKQDGQYQLRVCLREQGHQYNCWVPWQTETWPPSSNSPNNDTQTKSTTVFLKQGISTTKMN